LTTAKRPLRLPVWDRKDFETLLLNLRNWLALCCGDFLQRYSLLIRLVFLKAVRLMANIFQRLAACFVSGNARLNFTPPKRFSGALSGAQFNYQRLELRQPLAAFYLDPAGTLFVSGTEGPDQMAATVVQSNVLRVTMNQHVFQRPISDVQELVFLGRAGDDIISNHTSIPSRMFGGNGNDVLTGGSGNDRLIGNRGDDILNGRDGDDILIGSAGNNTLDGGNGNDRLFGGYGGRNVLRGGPGNDMIFAGDRGDEIYGDAGDDQIYGNVGPDLIFTGPGKNTVVGNGGDDVIHVQGSGNWVNGGSGNDSIYAQGSHNILRGGTGNDGILAMGTGNRVLPGAGKNRVLIPPGQPTPVLSANDAAIQFVNRNSNWTFKQMEAIDQGLKGLHHRTNGTMVLKDTTSNLPLTFAKYRLNDSALGGGAGANFIQGNFVIPPTGPVTATYQREIRVEDFDVNNSHRYRWAGVLAIHEISHNWDSVYEINQRLPGRGNIWNEFLNFSSWRNSQPGNGYTKAWTATQEPFEFQVVGGTVQIPVREWWYASASPFTRDYGKHNAKEDWAVTWEYMFMEPVYGSMLNAYADVPAKVAKVNQLLNLMS